MSDTHAAGMASAARRAPRASAGRVLSWCVLACLAVALAPAAAGSVGQQAAVTPVLPVTVTDADGDRVHIRNVSRIVPLNGDIAETVFTLGLSRYVVGVDVSATYPRFYANLPSIGYQRTLSAEAILSLRPTLVVGSTTAGPPEVIEQLRDAGVTVLIIRDYNSISGGATKLRVLGRALGVPARGNRLAAQVTRQIGMARREAASATSHPRVAFLYVRGDETQMIGGKGTGADAMIRAAGGIDAGGEAGINGFRPITSEALVAARPDVIVVLTAGLASVGGIEGLLRLPGVALTPAGRDRRIYDYDDLRFLGMGPRTGAALRELVRDLHPELR